MQARHVFLNLAFDRALNECCGASIGDDVTILFEAYAALEEAILDAMLDDSDDDDDDDGDGDDGDDDGTKEQVLCCVVLCCAVCERELIQLTSLMSGNATVVN